MSEIPCVSVKSTSSNGKATTFAGEIPTVSYLDNNWLIYPSEMTIYVISAFAPSKSPLNQLTHHGTDSSQHPIFSFSKRHVVQSRRRLCSKCAKSHPVVPCDTWAARAPARAETAARRNGEVAMSETTRIDGLYQQNTSGKGYVEGKVGG